MITVDGIILIISCQKFLHTRLKEINLKENYENWKVIKVIGDLFLDCDYKLEGNLLTIKCEDSYFHIMKKEVLSFQYLYEIFDIKDGILKCNDDLIFNENNLVDFLKSPKKHKINDCEYIDIDCMGKMSNDMINISMINHNFKYEPEKTGIDMLLVEYYKYRPEDIDNPLHNLKDVDFTKYIKSPYVPHYPGGPMVYLSNKSCKILINHMSNINYDIFHYDNITDSYPYTIEDKAIAFILLSNNINLIDTKYLYADFWDHTSESIALHTNKYK